MQKINVGLILLLSSGLLYGQSTLKDTKSGTSSIKAGSSTFITNSDGSSSTAIKINKTTIITNSDGSSETLNKIGNITFSTKTPTPVKTKGNNK